MSERYVTLFSLSKNLYAESSPVVIKSGVLLKDTSTEKILALIKFCNIGKEEICALRINISLFDIAGNPIGDNIVFQYLDLNVSRDMLFGQETPIVIPANEARSFSVTIAEVIFASKSSMIPENKLFTHIPDPKLLSENLDNELLKEYCAVYGKDCKYHTSSVMDLWYCTCGSLNKSEESKCHTCARTRTDFENIDIEALKKSRDERKSRDEKKIHKIKQLLIIVLTSLAAFLIIYSTTTFITNNIRLKNSYNEAMKLYENGDFEKARAAFVEMGSYSNCIEMIEKIDSEKKLLEEYGVAKDYLNNNNFYMAKQCFANLGDYKDSKEMITECTYLEAVHYVESDDYLKNPLLHPTSFGIFLSLGDYKDSQKYIERFQIRCISSQDTNETGATTYAYDEKGNTVSVCRDKYVTIYSYYDYGDWTFRISNRNGIDYNPAIYYKGNYITYIPSSYVTPTLQDDGTYIMVQDQFKAVFYPNGKFTIHKEDGAITDTTHTLVLNNKNLLVSHLSYTTGIAYNGEPYTESLNENFTYNEYSNVTEEIRDVYDGWQNESDHYETFYSYEYDENGRMTKKFKKNKDGEYQLTTTYLYDYVYIPEATQ